MRRAGISGKLKDAGEGREDGLEAIRGPVCRGSHGQTWRRERRGPFFEEQLACWPRCFSPAW